MKNAILITIILLSCGNSLLAQDSIAIAPAGASGDTVKTTKRFDWTLSGMVGVNFSATAVSGNWAGGEQNASGIAGFMEGTADREMEKLGWKSKFRAEYGQTKTGSNPAVKSTDLLHSDSYLRWKVLKRFNPYADLTMDTQFDVLLRPVILTQSMGMSAYLIDRPGQILSSRAGLALKEIYDPANILVNPINIRVLQSASDSASTRLYLGLSSVTNYDLSLKGSLKISTELRFFAPIDISGADMRWDNSLYMKLAKYFTLKIGYLALFDYNKNYPPVWPRDIRTKFTTGLGASWALF